MKAKEKTRRLHELKRNVEVRLEDVREKLRKGMDCYNAYKLVEKQAIIQFPNDPNIAQQLIEVAQEVCKEKGINLNQD